MSSKLTIRNAIIGVAGATASVLLFVGTGSTGADFSASQDGTVSIASGNLTAVASDAHGNTGTFKLAYANLAPGDSKADTFTIKNTGSIPADVKIGGVSVGANNLSGLNGTQVNYLKAGIDGYQASAPVSSLTGDIMLGSLNPGQSRTYTVRVSLDQAAGNEWQNRNVSASVTATLNQQ